MEITNRIRLNGKIQRYYSPRGETTYTLRIVRNYRESIDVLPTNKLVKTIISFKESELKDDFFKVAAWSKINDVLAKMHADGILSRDDMKKAKANFAKVLPHPIPQAFKPLHSGKVDKSKYDHILNPKK
jgi:hypothetical protein